MGCGLESGPYPAGSVVADEPGFVTGPAGRSPLASLGTTEHPGHESTTHGRIYLCLDAGSDFELEPELCYRPYLIFKHHPDRALFLQLLPQLNHLSSQVLTLFLLQNIR